MTLQRRYGGGESGFVQGCIPRRSSEKCKDTGKIRFLMVATLCRPDQNFPVSAIKRILEVAYCDRGAVNVISLGSSNFMFIFSKDLDATNAYAEIHDKVIGDFSRTNTAVQDMAPSR